MIKSRHASLFATLALPVLLHAAPALAVSKVWVSNAGVDGASCGAVTAPCRTFQKAHDNVPAGGEVGVLTPGDYQAGNRLMILKSINITNDGSGEASLLADSQNGSEGIFIEANAGDIISLRGLVIDGQGTAAVGLELARGAALHVQNCVIRNFEGGAGLGIWFPASGNSQLFVSDTIIFNNGNTTFTGGILVAPQGAGSSARVVLDRVHLENNVFGLLAEGSLSGGGGIRLIIRDSVVSGNAGPGIWSRRGTGSGATTVVLVDRTATVNNGGAGVLADGDAIALLSNATIEANGTGASVVNGGRLFSYGNNVIDNNVGEDLSPAAIARATK